MEYYHDIFVPILITPIDQGKILPKRFLSVERNDLDLKTFEKNIQLLLHKENIEIFWENGTDHISISDNIFRSLLHQTKTNQTIARVTVKERAGHETVPDLLIDHQHRRKRIENNIPIDPFLNLNETYKEELRGLLRSRHLNHTRIFQLIFEIGQSTWRDRSSESLLLFDWILPGCNPENPRKISGIHFYEQISYSQFISLLKDLLGMVE